MPSQSVYQGPALQVRKVPTRLYSHPKKSGSPQREQCERNRTDRHRDKSVESDVDVCVELQTPNMFSLVHIKEELQHLFGCAVDIVRLREDMDGILKQNIIEEGVYA
jgi:hypothetical protein